MNEKSEFSMEFTVGSGPAFKPLPDLVTFDLCQAYPMHDGKLLLHNTRNGQRAMVMPEVYSALLDCSEFRTLDEHIANIIKLNPGMQGQQSDIRKVLEVMIDSGIMLSAKEVSDSLKKDPENNATRQDGGAPVVVIITWERPAALERLLESIAANCNTGNFHSLYVVDDSRGPENISRNQALTEKFSEKIETPLHYFGQQQQQSLLSALIERLPKHEIAIRFLADQSRWRDDWTSGLARNLALLLSCGHRLVMLDDDTICDVYDPVQPKSGITVSEEPREADFFESEDDWQQQHQPINPDPIDRHMQCLGLTFSEALNMLGQNHLKAISFAHANALLVSELSPDSPVLMTECGSLGCPGTGANTWLPFMPADSLQRLQTSAHKSFNALNHRMAWCGRHQAHFSPRPTMSQITGFDNRQTLPPYLPIERGEDRLFGYMLDYIFPTGITLDYPWAIPHLPIPPRKWREEDRTFSPGSGFPVFFFNGVRMLKSSCMAGTPLERMHTLSAWFDDLAAAPDETLTNIFRQSVLSDGAEQLQILSGVQAATESVPDDWRLYLENGISALAKGMDSASDKNFPVKGVPRRLEGAGLIAFWKETWSDFADALRAWPEIRQAAAEIVSG